ncbi:Fur family transcriptional regulator [Thauera linaloolentis]|uniref:Zinc uptake transcriptional regulator protein, Fur family protein n=1 Tax=Thauera linaloolentis (strain DSM 12138 / JCM 21573 / CCUG 41526 / CIP 105981 / IAM 15112 / NBRC 102519 / 47Lol) TaxID=1123367 RepID=N6YWK6_THAL4|nr:Fur family transcriptional regulator [Thauera linaloolentis]ENO86508.1 zinc uptake transcriptional regulator protein, Fur family protein [Thauera linaloolentis 47Lol = DSM 12138]MCM8566505.1 transcriptional repressor [Thauera linaloolentis]
MAQAPQLNRHQTLVLGALLHAQEPVSAYALLEQLRGEGLRAPLQVYRALDKLIEYGLVHKLSSLNAFMACAHPHEHRHELISFAICERCGKVMEFSGPEFEAGLRRWAKEHAFRMESAAIELRGTCERCLSD